MNFKLLLLPTAENDYRPHLLQKAALLMMVLLVLLSFAAVNLQALLWQSSDWLVGTVLPAVVVDLTNTERKNINEPILKRSAVLDKAAQLKADDMAKNKYFAHFSPTGVSPWYWFEQAGYSYVHAGENLAIHFSDSGAVGDAWMNSPSHKANIVNGNYTEIGVGTAKGVYDGFDTVYVVQLFGAPAVPPASTVPPVAPKPTPIAVKETTVPPASNLATKEETLSIVTTPTELALGETLAQVAGEQSDVVLPVPATVAPSLPSSVKDVTEETILEQVPISEVVEVITNTEQTSVFSTHFSTSSGLAPLVETSMSGSTATKPSILGTIATQPSMLLQAIYIIIGSLVAFLLIGSVLVGVKNHRPVQIAYGVLLLMLMSGLFYVHLGLTTHVLVAQESSLNAIEAL
jgi:hypothetical protein